MIGDILFGILVILLLLAIIVEYLERKYRSYTHTEHKSKSFKKNQKENSKLYNVSKSICTTTSSLNIDKTKIIHMCLFNISTYCFVKKNVGDTLDSFHLDDIEFQAIKIDGTCVRVEYYNTTNDEYKLLTTFEFFKELKSFEEDPSLLINNIKEFITVNNNSYSSEIVYETPLFNYTQIEPDLIRITNPKLKLDYSFSLNTNILKPYSD